VRKPQPSWPELDVELPPESHPRPRAAEEESPPASAPKPGIFRRKRQIVVEVGSKGKGAQGRRRNTFKPESVMTQPAGTIRSKLNRKG
jgi:hypothetical protein